MKKKKILFILLVVFLLVLAYFFFQKNQKQAYQKSLFSQEEVKTISKYLAHLVISDLQVFSPYYEFDEVVRILYEIEKGQIEPLPSEDCHLALMNFHYRILEDEAAKNLKSVNQFFADLAIKDHIVEISKGKLYYQTTQSGFGAMVTENSIPLIHFTEYDLSGNLMRDTRKNEPIQISLKEAIPGFRQGVVGMQIGERRKIYVHPDLAYGKIAKDGQQQLVIFDVEIIELEPKINTKISS